MSETADDLEKQLAALKNNVRGLKREQNRKQLRNVPVGLQIFMG